MNREQLHHEICQIPVIDVHSHLNPGQLEAKRLQDVLYYHMLLYPLRACGVPEAELWRRRGQGRQTKLNPFGERDDLMPALQAQNFGRLLRQILADLYDFDQELTPASLPTLRRRFAARVKRPNWGREVLNRLNMERVMFGCPSPEFPDLGTNSDLFGLGIESGFYCGTHEYRPWTKRLERLGARHGKPVKSLDDLRQLAADYYGQFDWNDRRTYIAWISSDADFRPVTDRTVDRILDRISQGEEPGPDDSRLLEAATTRCICDALKDDIRIFQVVYGIQFISPGPALHPVVKQFPQFAAGLGRLAGEYPQIHFNILNGCEADEQTLCSLCNAYTNVSLAGFWWNSFFPSIMHSGWQRRLDMVPLTRLCGFFSDGYCVDWIYARVRTVQRVLANVLFERIEHGFCRPTDAVPIAQALLHDTPKRLFFDQA